MKMKRIITVTWLLLMALFFMGLGGIISPGFDKLNKIVIAFVCICTLLNVLLIMGVYKESKVSNDDRREVENHKRVGRLEV